jgi:hypothetical protein
MVSKEDLCDQLKKLLTLDVDFSRMNKADLEKLWSFLTDPSKVVTMTANYVREKARKEILDVRLRDIIEKPLQNDDSGPLGLGILPSLRKKIFIQQHKQKEQS